jgi:hypothetical protein
MTVAVHTVDPSDRDHHRQGAVLSGRAKTALTDREGVAIFQRIVSRDLGWIFREQTVVDQGVDGQVEVAIEGHGTGRLIAVQIKSGSSYFKSVKGGGRSTARSASANCGSGTRCL